MTRAERMPVYGGIARLDVASMRRTAPPAVPWMVEGLLARRALTILAGPPAVGKSLIGMALAAGVALGAACLGSMCTRGDALILDAENAPDEIHRRVRALELPPSVEYGIPKAVGCDLRRDIGMLGQLLAVSDFDLLVLDSFRSFWGGDECDSREVALVLDPLRRLAQVSNAAILLLHHTARGHGEYRGSSAIAGCADLGFDLTPVSSRDKRCATLRCWKSRVAAAPEPCRLEFTWLTDRCSITCVQGAGSVEHQLPRLCPDVLAALDHGPGRRADIARRLRLDSKTGSVGDALSALVTAGIVIRQGDEYSRVAATTDAVPPIRERAIAGAGR